MLLGAIGTVPSPLSVPFHIMATQPFEVDTMVIIPISQIGKQSPEELGPLPKITHPVRTRAQISSQGVWTLPLGSELPFSCWGWVGTALEGSCHSPPGFLQ